MRNRLKWLIGVVVALVVLIPVGTFVYIHFIEGKAPDRLSLDTTTGAGGSSATGSATPSGSIDGTWQPTPASQVGYRVKEVLFGQNNEAVGRTNKVTGSMTVSGTTVSATNLTVDMASVSSDKSQRDNQFRGRIMDVSKYPTATFELTQPIQLPAVPTDATPVDAKATGELTMHGATKPVTVELKAQRDGATIKVNGTIPVTFSDWGIPNPSFGPVSTEDHGELELLVVFQKTA